MYLSAPFGCEVTMLPFTSWNRHSSCGCILLGFFDPLDVRRNSHLCTSPLLWMWGENAPDTSRSVIAMWVFPGFLVRLCLGFPSAINSIVLSEPFPLPLNGHLVGRHVPLPSPVGRPSDVLQIDCWNVFTCRVGEWPTTGGKRWLYEPPLASRCGGLFSLVRLSLVVIFRI